MKSTRSILNRRQVKHFYYSIRNQILIYRWVTNLRNTFSYLIFVKNRFNNLPENQIIKRIVSDLRNNGIAFSSIDEFFPQSDYFQQMAAWLNKNEKNLVFKSKKKFLMSYHGNENSILDLDSNNPFINFYLSDYILKIVCDYLGYIPQLNYLTIEKTLVMNESSAVHSQLWHRDPEEQKMIKVFIYLNDVSENNGPFFYVKGSQPSGNSKMSKFAPQYLPKGSYPDEMTVMNTILSDAIVCATGKAGTIIFCDTAGLHKGGLAVEGERKMSTAFFPSKKWSEPALLRKSKTSQLNVKSDLAKKILKNSIK